MESNQEQTLADIEKVFEDSKASRFQTRNAWKSAKGRFHSTLVARREAGHNLTIADMKAMEDAAIDNVDYVREAYLEFIESDSKFRQAKVRFEDAKRKYWDSKPIR
jgi:hypothetical protein